MSDPLGTRCIGYVKDWFDDLLSRCPDADSPRSIVGLCLLAPYPDSRLTTTAIAGGREWPVWQQLWEHFVDPGFSPT